MRIYILDDCEILRVSLSLIIQKEEELHVVGSSDSDVDVCAQVMQSGCDILLIGLRLKNGSGLEFTRRLRAARSNICIVALGYSTDSPKLQEMLHAGIDSFISTSLSNEEIIAKILEVTRKENQCNFSITESCDRLTILP